MKLQTPVEISPSDFLLQPFERMLFVGSCFADHLGRRCQEDLFRAVVNPFGVMYNPASILHTVKRTSEVPRVAVFTLGTNRVYILKETGEIVDNCQKKPQKLFREEQLSIKECVDFLSEAIEIMQQRDADLRVLVTVSPIRYAKYGFHGSRLSKAVLLLAADELVKKYPQKVTYFPAYELLNDELRDYRFYASDMIHPSEQAIDYVWERFSETFFAATTKQLLHEWEPIKKVFAHRPFHPDSAEWKTLRTDTLAKAEQLLDRYGADEGIKNQFLPQ